MLLGALNDMNMIINTKNLNLKKTLVAKKTDSLVRTVKNVNLKYCEINGLFFCKNFYTFEAAMNA